MTNVSLRGTVLVVDDEPSICWAFRNLLESNDYAVKSASSGEEAIELVQQGAPDLCILDIRLPGMSGLEALTELRKRVPGMPILMMTAHGTMDAAVEAIRLGANDYLTKPMDNQVLLQQVSNLIKQTKSARLPQHDSLDLTAAKDRTLLVGRSAAMQEVFKKIGAVADSDASVLITGETGTGKELVAQAIHRYSSRASKPFFAVNCASMPETLLESELYGHVKGAFTGALRDKPGKAQAADGGTLFMDEIGEAPHSLQAKLLRFLEEKRFEPVGSTESVQVDVRFVAATNRNLLSRIRDGLFREDLFFRLNTICIELPSLRERKEDIPLLLACFLDRLHREMGTPVAGVSKSAIDLIMRYDWPGNVRELRNAITHAAVVARGQRIQEEHLPERILRVCRGESSENGDALERLLREKTQQELDALAEANEGEVYDRIIRLVEKAILETTMERTSGNQVKASRMLGMNRSTLRKRLEIFEI